MLHTHPGTANPADILSKHWAYSKVWATLRPLLFMQWMPESLDEHEDTSGNVEGE